MAYRANNSNIRTGEFSYTVHVLYTMHVYVAQFNILNVTFNKCWQTYWQTFMTLKPIFVVACIVDVAVNKYL